MPSVACKVHIFIAVEPENRPLIKGHPLSGLSHPAYLFRQTRARRSHPEAGPTAPRQRNKPLKYVLLIYQPDPFNFTSLPEHEQHEIGAAYGALTKLRTLNPVFPWAFRKTRSPYV